MRTRPPMPWYHENTALRLFGREPVRPKGLFLNVCERRLECKSLSDRDL